MPFQADDLTAELRSERMLRGAKEEADEGGSARTPIRTTSEGQGWGSTTKQYFMMEDDELGILLVFGQRSFLTLVSPACRTPPHEPDATVREEVEGDTGVIVAVDRRQAFLSRIIM